MPTDQVLIPSPVLDARTEAARIAARLDRTIGNYTLADAELGRDTYEDLITLINDNLQTAVIDRLAPELSSVRPAEAHVVLLTEMERAGIEMQFALNQLPEQNRIALYRILGVTLQAAIAATTTLLFTKSSGAVGTSVTIPQGTEVTSQDRSITVATTAPLVLGVGVPSGSVAAASTVAGDIGRIPTGAINVLTTSIAGILTVSNTTDLAGGRNAESTAQAEIRAREEMRAGERLLTAEDWTDFIYFELLRRKGRVTAFEFYLGNFAVGGLGYLLLIVQDENGLAASNATLQLVSETIAVKHAAGLQITAREADYKNFSILADITIKQGASADLLKQRAEQNLRAFFAPLTFDYGPNSLDRFISLSDIVGQIEQAGPDKISVVTIDNKVSIILVIGDVAYQQDVSLEVGQLPNLVDVTFTVI